MNNVVAYQAENEQPINFKTPDKNKLLSLSFNDKIKYVDELRIFYPKMNQILKTVEECLNSTQSYEKPKCLRIIGPSGSGKSTIFSVFQKRHPIITTDTKTIVPVLYSRVPCPAYIGGLAIKLLHDLGDPFFGRSGKITFHTQRLFQLLKSCDVKIIFLDEVQHLVDRNSQKLLRDSSDWFKQLIDETKIPIVFLGMPDSNKIFLENDQLANRVRLVETVSPFEYDDIFKKLLYLYDMSLPIKDLSGLSNPNLSKRIYLATGGYIKHIHDLFLESTIIAMESNSTRITMPILATAFNKILFEQYETNPFLPGFEV